MYDYREAVKDDVLEYINNEINFEDFDTLEELEEHLNEVLFTEDSVTGNASGSYTFNTYEAEENICHNLDLLGEALEDFGSGADYLITHGAEAARRAYNNGLRVMLCPVNLRPGYPYHPETSISGKAAATFEEALNAFEFYNIRGNETGHYTAFYIPVREVDRFTGEAPTAATLGTVTQYDYRYIGG